jgi:hypothetical protein
VLKRMKARKVEVEMLHIGLGSNWWYLTDIFYVLTGKVLF